MKARIAQGAVILGAAYLATACSVVFAADETPQEIIVTAKRTSFGQGEALANYAGSASVIGADAIALAGATHHADIMNRAPGAMIQRNTGQESLTALRSPVLTGAGACGAFLFLENSVPIRPVGFCNVNELFEVDTQQADRIEILRGPAGVLYGSSAMHGAINVLQAWPTQRTSQRISTEIGPDDFYRARVAFRQVGETSFSTSGVVTDDGGWRDHARVREQKLNVALERQLDSAHLGLRLSATNLDQQTAGYILGEDSYRDAVLARSNFNPEAFRDAYAVRLVGEFESPVGTRAALNVRPYLRSSHMKFLQHFLIGKPLEENGQNSLGVMTTLRTRAFTSTAITTGIDLEVARGTLEQTQDGPATDGTAAANAIRPAGKHYDYAVRSGVAALYAQVDQPFLEHWQLSAGARFEYVHYAYDNRMLSGNTNESGVPCGRSGCLYSRPADRSDDFANLTPKLALSYALDERHTAYLNATRGYRAPDTSELYRLQRQQSMAELDSERLDSLELGLRGAFPQLHYSMAVFTMRKDQVIFRDSAGFNIGNGRTRHRGAEYELSWSPSERVSLSLQGTYAKHTYDFNRAIEGGETIVAGNDVDTAPRHFHAARLHWQLLPTLGAELEWQSVGRYWLDAINAHEYEGHDLLNLRARWTITPSWSLTARMNNLSDRAYADRADYAFGKYRYFPGRGRSTFVELQYRIE